MPCTVCGIGIRMFYESELICPSCNGIKIKEKSRVISELKDSLAEDLNNFKILIENCNYNRTLSSILELRESVAEKLYEMPGDEEASRIWITCLYILANLPEEPKPFGIVPPNEVLASANLVIDGISAITLCEQDKIVYLENGVKCQTELQALYRLPDKVYDKVLEELGDKSIEDKKHILEQMMKSLMIEHFDIVNSEALSRNLRASFPRYLLQYNDLNKMKELAQVAYGISFEIANRLGTNFLSNSGLLQMSMQDFLKLKTQITKGLFFSANDLFSPPNLNKEGDNLALHIFVRDNKRDIVYLPFHSLVLLGNICHKYVLDTDEYRKNIGENPEDWLFDLIKGHLETTTPIGGKELHRFKLGGNLGEIDAAGFNDKKIVVVESKFRETLTVSELETELKKFEKTLINFIKRKEMYGFSNSQEVIPLFYTPWPPFSTFGKTGITLIPTISSFIWYLQSNFPPKNPKFVKTNNSINNFLNSDSAERLYMTDMSNFSDVEIEKYRVQDLQIDDISEDEVVAYAFSPLGRAFPFIFDIEEGCLKKIKLNGVKRGSVIRACTYNLNGNWTRIQLVDFKIIYLEKQLDPDRILTELNPKQYEEFLAFYNAGREAERLLEIVNINNIDLKKYMIWAKNKGYNINIAIGRLMGIDSGLGQKLIQCECGNVMSFPKQIYKKITIQFGSSLKCKDCDPSLFCKVFTSVDERTGAFLIY